MGAVAAVLAAVLLGAAAVPAAPPGTAPTGTAPPGTAPTGKLVPKSTLPGPGAFMGPVRTVPANGIEIGYRQFGHGPDLVMISGDTAPMTLWLPYLVKPLARHFTVTIFDNRGVGYSSDDLSQRMTIQLMARDTAGLIEALGLERPTVLGWSMGGEIGITLAERRPDLLAALVTSGANAGGPHAKQPADGLLRKIAHPSSPTFLLDVLFPDSRAGARAAAKFGREYQSLRQEDVSRRTLDRQEKAELRFARYPEVWDALPTIEVPYLITNGALDRLNPVVNARRLHRRVPGSRLTVYKGAGHGMMYQDSPRFVSEVVRFAAR